MNEAMKRADEVREMAQTYLRRTGMAPADFAARVGYRYSSLQPFLAGKSRNERGEPQMCAAILRYFEAHPMPPADEYQGRMYEIGNLKVMRDIFTKLVAKPCITMVYAPPGSGKTDVARALITEHSRSGSTVSVFRVYCRARITPRDLMRRIAQACGSPADLSIERTIHNLAFDFKGRRVVLYIDEAQHLAPECFETVRELYDEMGWSLCFAGSHELDRVFMKWAGTLEQLERRVTEKVYLPTLTAEEASGILRSELPGLDNVQIRRVIEASTVDIRANKQAQRYISIGRVMATIRELQEAAPAAADHVSADLQEVQ